MNKSILIFAIALLLFSCGNNNSNSEKKKVVAKVQTPKPAPQKPVLHVYNMGGVPKKRMEILLHNLKAVYPSVAYDGQIAFNEKTHIKTDMGNDRYGATWIMDDMKKRYNLKNSIQLVIVNAEVCDWKYNTETNKKQPHALFGNSYLNGRQSVIGYSRFVKTKRLTDENLFKIVMHELGHVVGGLVSNRKSDGAHCPNTKCLMVNANNGFPYTPITGFCESCDKVMRSKGFETTRMGFK